MRSGSRSAKNHRRQAALFCHTWGSGMSTASADRTSASLGCALHIHMGGLIASAVAQAAALGPFRCATDPEAHKDEEGRRAGEVACGRRAKGMPAAISFHPNSWETEGSSRIPKVSYTFDPTLGTATFWQKESFWETVGGAAVIALILGIAASQVRRRRRRHCRRRCCCSQRVMP